MGVLQHLCGVAFLIFYSLSLGGFLGPERRTKVMLAALASAGAFVATADLWVHGVLLIALAVVGVGAYLALAWLLKSLCEAALCGQATPMAVRAPEKLAHDVAAPAAARVAPLGEQAAQA